MEHINLGARPLSPPHSPSDVCSSGGEGADDGSGVGNAAPGLAGGGREGVVGQVDLPCRAELVPHDGGSLQPRFAHRSPELMLHARQHLALQRTQERLRQATTAANTAQSTLDLVAKVLPGAGALLGGSASRRRLDKKSAVPTDFCALALVAYVPCKRELQVGVKRKRLICAVANLLKERQASALQTLLANGRMRFASRPASTWSLFAYGHQWDESRAFFARFTSAEEFKHRAARTGQHVQMLVQRGACHFLFDDADKDQSAHYTEQWLIPHTVVDGTSAQAIHPAIVASMPSCMRWQEAAPAHELAQSMDISVFLPLGDKASSNVLLQKRWGYEWEFVTLPSVGPKVLYLAESCQVHQHHRGKAQLPLLRRHLGRHYSTVQMSRLPEVQKKYIAYIEAFVSKGFVRDMRTPSPASAKRVRAFFSALYGLDDGRHIKANGKEPTYIRDIRQLVDMANGQPGQAVIRHHCKASPGASPCCKSNEDALDKLTTAMVNVLVGGADKLPTESRWANLVPCMKRTLSRCFMYNLGLHVACHPGEAAETEPFSMDDDAQASGEFMKKIAGVRAKRACEYLLDARSMWELAILTIGLDTVDGLLLAMLGGLERKEAPITTEALLDRSTSLIGKTQAALLELFSAPPPPRHTSAKR